MNRNKSVWSKGFTRITVATVLSAIGGEAMNLPISMLVFDKTGSSFMSSIILAAGIIPDFLLPVLVAPLIDKGNKKRWIVSLDCMMCVIFAAMGFWTLNNEFSYGLYLIFTLVIGIISVFYRLAFDAWYPDLIPDGMEQQGYAVSTTIYPTVIIMVSPLATFAYTKVPIGAIFLFVAALTAASIICENGIPYHIGSKAEKYTLDMYFDDIKAGFRYIKKEKGIRNIYTYMSVSGGTSQGVGLVSQTFFQSHAAFTVVMYGFLQSAEMVGRMLAGLALFKKEIPRKKRYTFTKFVYTFYDTSDSLILFMPYPLMLITKFFQGMLGASSATVRHAATQSYLPRDMRARVNAFFNVIFSLGEIGFTLLAGALGQVLPYRVVPLILGGIVLTAMVFLIFIPAKDNRPVYEARLQSGDDESEVAEPELCKEPEANNEVEADRTHEKAEADVASEIEHVSDGDEMA